MFQNCFSATCMVILLFLLPNGQPLQAQTVSPQSITIKGQVLDEYARPLPGASITTKAGPDKIITDADGRFQVSAAMNSILVVSHPLFDVQVITIRSDKELLLKLTERTCVLCQDCPRTVLRLARLTFYTSRNPLIK